MTTLYSSVIHLISTQAAVLTSAGGQHGHAAFLDIIRQVDPALSQALHNTRGKGARQPFTVSPLQGLPKPRRRKITLHQGRECWLRITILDDALFRTFIEHFLYGDARPTLRLGKAHFLVSEIASTPGSHPWAGFTDIEHLQSLLNEPVPHKFAFEFHTPTAFGWINQQVSPMPLPRLVFGNLASAWRRLTGEDYVRAVENYAEDNLFLGSFDLHTRALRLYNKPQIGAVGQAEYIRADKGDNPLARTLNLLTDFAFYAGIGRKTAQGMGQVRRIVE